jgi:hypothetical protein
MLHDTIIFSLLSKVYSHRNIDSSAFTPAGHLLARPAVKQDFQISWPDTFYPEYEGSSSFRKLYLPIFSYSLSHTNIL